MKIYIAASYLRRDDAKRLRARLRDAGHVIICRWIDGPEPVEQYIHSDALMEEFCSKDFEDVIKAQALVCITGDAPGQKTRGGKHTEFGIALGTGMRVFLLGPREQIFHWHRAVRIAATESELIALLAA